GAVERIDDEGVRPVGTFAPAAFLAEKTVARPRLGKLLMHDFLGAAVGRGDEIGRPLERDLQMFDFPEVALERAAGFTCGLDHDVEESRMQHDQRSPVHGSWERMNAKISSRSGN